MTHENGRRAIAEQFEQRYPGLLQALIRTTKSRQLAEDLISEAIVKMLEKSDQPLSLDFHNVAGYIFRTSCNLLLNHRRKIENKASLRAPASALENLSEPDFVDRIEQAESAKQTREVLESLPQRDQAILIAAFFKQEDKSKLCTDFALSTRQLDKVISRARKRMRNLIELAQSAAPKKRKKS